MTLLDNMIEYDRALDRLALALDLAASDLGPHSEHYRKRCLELYREIREEQAGNRLDLVEKAQ